MSRPFNGLGLHMPAVEEHGTLQKISGVNCETAYLIITDHRTDYIWGIAADSKAPPMTWLNRWFTQYDPAGAPFRYVALIQSGELFKNKEVMALMPYHRYTPHPAGGDASWQNTPGDTSTSHHCIPCHGYATQRGSGFSPIASFSTTYSHMVTGASPWSG
jgi:hypothetical protein